MAAPQGLQLPPGEALSEGISLLAESRLESGAGALTAGVLLPFEAVTALQGQGGSELPSQSTSTPTPGGAGFIDALSGLRATPASGGTAPPGGGVLQSPLGSAPWRDELGGRLTLMLDRGEQFATLQLTPEDLGPLEIRIALREGEATVWFGSQAPEARAAIEQALPRLRELFAAGGLSLADAGVFSGSPEDPQRSRSASSLARAARESGDDAGMQVAADPRVRRGLLDLYA
jgi:flagellar hook-length control protein FliK